MSNQVELHDCGGACPLAHAGPATAVGDGIGRRAFLTQGALVEATNGGFTCPRHKAQFSTTGDFVGGPARIVQAFEGLQPRNLRSYLVQYNRKKGTLTIEI
jgi:Rieske Fe-S protein